LGVGRTKGGAFAEMTESLDRVCATGVTGSDDVGGEDDSLLSSLGPTVVEPAVAKDVNESWVELVAPRDRDAAFLSLLVAAPSGGNSSNESGGGVGIRGGGGAAMDAGMTLTPGVR
jgi:hypothetical protein